MFIENFNLKFKFRITLNFINFVSKVNKIKINKFKFLKDIMEKGDFFFKAPTSNNIINDCDILYWILVWKTQRICQKYL